jgi:hypothetical protein
MRRLSKNKYSHKNHAEARGACHLRGNLAKSEAITLQLLDTQGRVMRSSQHQLPMGAFEVDIARGDLPIGIYLLQLQTTEGVQTQKVVFE